MALYTCGHIFNLIKNINLIRLLVISWNGSIVGFYFLAP